MKIKSIISKACKIVALVSTCAVVSLQAPYVHQKYIRSVAEESTVQIYGQDGTGSGSHVELANGKTVILTNKHICQMQAPLTAKAEGEKEAKIVKIIKISDKHDLCVLEGIPGHKGLKLGSSPELGDELYTLGHPRGDALTVAKGEFIDTKPITLMDEFNEDGTCSGKIERIQIFIFVLDVCTITRDAVQLSTPTYQGNSGSPVVNKYGNLVAVIFAGNQQIENMGFAVPFKDVVEFLSSIN